MSSYWSSKLMKEIKISSPAKINLHLQVLKRRSDGFHDIASAMQLIDLSDEMSFELSKEGIELIEDPFPIENNLILKAAKVLQRVTNANQGVKIKLQKKIPIQKGLGGGSSNAATTLVVLNKIWKTKLSHKQLLKIGTEIGSDVPFFIHGQSAWVRGKGEILEYIDLQSKKFILIFPETAISTKTAFANLTLDKEVAISVEDFKQGTSKNSFSNWARKTYPEIDALFNKLEKIGNPRLTGTGSAIFLDIENHAQVSENLKKFPNAILVKSIDRSPLLQLIE